MALPSIVVVRTEDVEIELCILAYALLVLVDDATNGGQRGGILDDLLLLQKIRFRIDFFLVDCVEPVDSLIKQTKITLIIFLLILENETEGLGLHVIIFKMPPSKDFFRSVLCRTDA